MASGGVKDSKKLTRTAGSPQQQPIINTSAISTAGFIIILSFVFRPFGPERRAVRYYNIVGRGRLLLPESTRWYAPLSAASSWGASDLWSTICDLRTLRDITMRSTRFVSDDYCARRMRAAAVFMRPRTAGRISSTVGNKIILPRCLYHTFLAVINNISNIIDRIGFASESQTLGKS